MFGLTSSRGMNDLLQIVCCDVSEEWTNIGKKYWEEAGVTDKIGARVAS